ncbi:peptidylprolyl isomerase [Zavarzinella formosa]|uniref:peptidylprolyl isomerase n=1 Tax=Zavarzinella formosa TaxID=360055 RepID=UPI0002F1B30E|nr:peptidylprolyl isomerase [Zavarzinella formosa]
MPDMIRPAVQHGSETLSLGDFLHAMKRSRRLRPMLLDAFVETYLVSRARRSGITVSELELQQAADQFRMRNGMASAEQTREWFLREAISEADFAAGLERDLLVEKLRRSVVDSKVEQAFNANLQRFARVRFRRVLVGSEGEARDTMDAIGSGRSNFDEQARVRSLDLATKNSGGDGGVIRRVDLNEQLANIIFQAEIGQLLGPIQAGQGYLVVRVEEFLPAEMDDGIRNGIRKELFDGWLRNELSKAPIEFPLLEALNAGQIPLTS